MYVVIGDTVAGQGIFSADDPWVAAYLDQQVMRIAPFLHRQGQPQTVERMRGKGTLYEWAGKNPKGDPVRAMAFAAIINQHGVALLALGLQGKLAPRDKAVRRMFASFNIGPGKIDPQAVGTWYLKSVFSCTN